MSAPTVERAPVAQESPFAHAFPVLPGVVAVPYAGSLDHSIFTATKWQLEQQGVDVALYVVGFETPASPSKSAAPLDFRRCAFFVLDEVGEPFPDAVTRLTAPDGPYRGLQAGPGEMWHSRYFRNNHAAGPSEEYQALFVPASEQIQDLVAALDPTGGLDASGREQLAGLRSHRAALAVELRRLRNPNITPGRVTVDDIDALRLKVQNADSEIRELLA